MVAKRIMAALSSAAILLTSAAPVFADNDAVIKEISEKTTKSVEVEKTTKSVENENEPETEQDIPASEQLVYEVIPDDIEKKAKKDEDFAEAVLQDPIYLERLEDYAEENEGTILGTDEDGNTTVVYEIKKYEAAAKASTSGAWNPSFTLYHQSQFDNCSYEYVIDVSQWNGAIDWNKVYNAGIHNVIIRVGYSGYGNGVNYIDGNFSSYIKGAKAAGLKVGAYYYSASVTPAEAATEAKSALQWVKNSGVSLDFPIWYDFECSDGRCSSLTNVSNNMNMVKSFCNYIWDNGYNAGFYSYLSYIQSRCDQSVLNSYYPVWLAHYNNSTWYSGKFQLWQFSSTQYVNGLSGNVDVSVWYKEATAPNGRTIYTDNTSVGDVPKSSVNIKTSTSDPYHATMSWSKVSGADFYRVYAKDTSWVYNRISDYIYGTSCTITLREGKNRFTVRAGKKVGSKEILSENYYDYDVYVNTGDIELANITLDKIKTEKSSAGKVKISWNSVDNAQYYRVYKSTNGKFNRIVDYDYNNYFIADLTEGDNIFTVRAGAKNSLGKEYLSPKYYSFHVYEGNIVLDNIELSDMNVTFKSTSPQDKNAVLSWKSINNAAYYRVYDQSTGKWKRLTPDTTNTAYNVKLSNGVNHLTVRAGVKNNDGEECLSPKYYDLVIGVDDVTGLKFTKSTGGYTLSWDKVSRATYYVVYDVTANDSTGHLTATNSYTVPEASKGHTFAVIARQAYNLHYFDSLNKTQITIKDAVIPKVNNTLKIASSGLNSIKVQWTKTADTSDYKVSNYILRMYNDKGLFIKTISVASNSSSYTFSNLLPNSGYIFTLSVKADSGYSPVSNKVYGATKINNVKIGKTSVTDHTISADITSIDNIDGYNVYRYNTSSKTWDLLMSIKNDSVNFKVEGLSSNTSYKIGTQAYRTINGIKTTSEKISEITASTLLAKTVITNAVQNENSVALTWEKVSGAQGYVVYKYDEVINEWVRYKKTTNADNSLTVTGLSSGTSYKFTVRAYKTVSGKEQLGYSYTTYATSTIPAKVSWSVSFPSSRKVKYSWNKVDGATGYILYYRINGEKDWTRVKISGTNTIYKATSANQMSFTASGFKSNIKYDFTLKAIREINGVTYNGKYNIKTYITK